MKVVDMHCDTISELLHIRKQWEHDTMLENHLPDRFEQNAEGRLSSAEFCHVCASRT